MRIFVVVEAKSESCGIATECFTLIGKEKFHRIVREKLNNARFVNKAFIFIISIFRVKRCYEEDGQDVQTSYDFDNDYCVAHCPQEIFILETFTLKRLH